MKMLVNILIVVGAIIALLLIVALFIKKEYQVARQITISKPKQDVFHYIKYLRNQDNYSRWATIDPGMKKEYRGTDGTPGFTYAWDSKDRKAGKGEQEIKSITEGQAVDYNLHFIKPFEGRATARMTTEATSQTTTTVRWGFQGKMAYPMNLMLLFMNMDKMIGDDLQTGLNNLKQTLEKAPLSDTQTP